MLDSSCRQDGWTRPEPRLRQNNTAIDTFLQAAADLPVAVPEVVGSYSRSASLCLITVGASDRARGRSTTSRSVRLESTAHD